MSRVSYVMMNPEGREQLTAAVQQAVDELVGRAHGRRPASSATTCSTWSPSATRSCTTSCSASTRRRSGRRRSRSPPTCPWTHGPRTSASAARAPGSTCCPASPATSAPTPRRRSSPKDRTAATTCSSWSTSGPTPRSCSATGVAARRVQPDRPRAGGRPDLLRPAGDARGHRAGAHRPRHARAPLSASSAATVWSDEPGFDGEPAAGRHHRRVRLGDHRGRRRAVPGRRPRRRRHHRRRAGRSHAAGRPGRPRVRLRAARRATAIDRRSASPRTTSAPSSWPRPRCRPACGC